MSKLKWLYAEFRGKLLSPNCQLLGGSIPGALPNIAAVAQVMAELVSSLTQEVATYPWTAALAKALDPVALSESREVG